MHQEMTFLRLIMFGFIAFLAREVLFSIFFFCMVSSMVDFLLYRSFSLFYTSTKKTKHGWKKLGHVPIGLLLNVCHNRSSDGSRIYVRFVGCLDETRFGFQCVMTRIVHIGDC